MLDKTYRPQEVEDRQYARWEEAQAFKAQFDQVNAVMNGLNRLLIHYPGGRPAAP